MIVYAIVAATAMAGGSVGHGERMAIGGVVDFHYLLSWLDRNMRPNLDSYSRNAPLAGFVAATMLTLSPGNVFAAGPVLLAIGLYQYGYYRSNAFGWYSFGPLMSATALVGVVLLLLEKAELVNAQVGLAETLLVAAGLVAGLRSITALLLGREERVWAASAPSDNDSPCAG